jgi:hypothetical protein
MLTKTDIEQYFIVEKQESLLFLAIGIAGVALAIAFWFFVKTPFYKGMAIPLLLVGLMLGIVGFTVYQRSNADRIRVVYALDMDPAAIGEKELPRMETVMKNFVVYRYVEILLALTGIALGMVFWKNPDRLFWKGMGLGLAIMAITALGADYFAEKRGHHYIKAIRSFVSQL